MTLKEKFVEADRYSIMKTTLADRCEIVADDYAIEFSVWTHNLRTDCEKGITEYSKWENTSNKELLEIYKKEKGL